MRANLEYPILSMSDATDETVQLFERVKKKFGGIPPIKGAIANSPVTLESYLDISDNFSKAGFTPTEQQIAFLTISLYNQCDYCTKAHTNALKNIFKLPGDIVDSILAEQPTGDAKVDALVDTCRSLMDHKGEIPEEIRVEFVAAGYSERQLIDLLSAIAMKAITNYFGRLSGLG